jgi:hypothetical protein
MDKLKPFAIPLVALALLLIWYFFVNPRLSDEAPAEAGNSETQKSEK